MTEHFNFSFMPAGGQTGETVRTKAWSGHPLGPPATWSASLRTLLAMLFGSRHPMLLWWGTELYQFYNDGFLGVLADKHPTAMGQRGADCWPEAWPLIWPQIDDAFRRGEASWNKDRCVPVTRNGVTLEAYWTYGYSPVYEADGQIAGVLAVVTEVTDRVAAIRTLHESQQVHRESERNLFEARQQLHDFLMQLPVGIAVLDGPEHVYQLLNPIFRTMCFGGRPEKRLSGTVGARGGSPNCEIQGFYEILDTVYRTGEPFLGAKVRASMLQSDGTQKDMFLNFTYQARRSSAGLIQGILAVIYEVTDQVNEQKEIEVLADSLRAAILSRDTFLGVASHELNTPLTALKLQVQLHKRALERQGIAPFNLQKVHKLVSDAGIQIGRLERLVDDMLDVARISSGNLSMCLSAADLSQPVTEMAGRLQPLLQVAGCSLHCAIEPGITARFDGARIEQVLTNMATNAGRYAPGHPVYLSLQSVGGNARVSLRDSGRGIDPQKLERIFGRFERATPAKEVSGLGLGLYICLQIIQQHGGSIRAENAPEGGAVISFDLTMQRVLDA